MMGEDTKESREETGWDGKSYHYGASADSA